MSALALLLLGTLVLEPVRSESERCSSCLPLSNTTAGDLDEIAVLQVQKRRAHVSGDTPATLLNPGNDSDDFQPRDNLLPGPKKAIDGNDMNIYSPHNPNPKQSISNHPEWYKQRMKELLDQSEGLKESMLSTMDAGVHVKPEWLKDPVLPEPVPGPRNTIRSDVDDLIKDSTRIRTEKERHFDKVREGVRAELGDPTWDFPPEPSAATPKTPEEIAQAKQESMIKAYLWKGVAQDVNSMIPTIKSCIKTDCDTAALTQQLLDVASSAMIAASFLVPAGPIIAMVGSVIAGFLREDKQGPPPLTVDDIRGAVKEELHNFHAQELQWNMRAWSESLAGEVLSLASLVDNKGTPKEYVFFEQAGLASLVNSVGPIAIKLSAGIESLVDFRNKIKSTQHFATTCPEVCKNDRDYKWPAACFSNLKDVQSHMRNLYDGIKLFIYAGSRLNTIKLNVDTIFDQQNWTHNVQWLRLDGKLKPVLDKYQSIKKLQLKMEGECGPDKNEFLMQHCNVQDKPMLDIIRRVPGWNIITFGAGDMATANTVMSPGLTKESCNYEELMVVSHWTCAGPESSCSGQGAGWKKIGVTSGGGCEEKTCCMKQLEKLTWMKPHKKVRDECENLCNGGGKDICTRPRVCAKPKCGEIVTDDKAWELKCGIWNCFW